MEPGDEQPDSDQRRSLAPSVWILYRPGRRDWDTALPELGDPIELHVVRVCEQPLPAATGWLDADELTRVQRYRHVSARNELIAGRFLARQALARLTGAAPASIQFVIGRLGMPRLVLSGEIAGAGFSFSIAHSHGLVMFAIGRLSHVGVDVEPLQRASSMPRMWRHILCESEWASIQSLSPLAQERALLERWLDKEAYGKSLGLGLQVHFNRIVAEPLAGQRMRFESADGSQRARVMNHWYMAPEPNYLAALLAGPAGPAVPRVKVHDFGKLTRVTGSTAPRIWYLNSITGPRPTATC